MNAFRRHWLLWTALGLLALFMAAHYYGWLAQGLNWGWRMGPGLVHGGWSMGFMGLPMILFWALVVAIIWSLAAAFSGDGSAFRSQEGPPSAREILDQRYARGELTRDEYLAMRRDLDLHRRPSQ